jgi:hypothetical protein
MSDEPNGIPVEWEQFGVEGRKEFIQRYYPDGEPRFENFSVVPYLFKDCIRSFVMGFRVSAFLSAMATIEKLLAQETGEEYISNIVPEAEEMGLIENPDEFNNQLKAAYNSDKHHRDEDDEDHVASRMERIASDRGVESGVINIYAYLEYEAEDAIKMLLQLLSQLDCVDIVGKPQPYARTPW